MKVSCEVNFRLWSLLFDGEEDDEAEDEEESRGNGVGVGTINEGNSSTETNGRWG